jgi:hypothetical protein
VSGHRGCPEPSEQLGRRCPQLRGDVFLGGHAWCSRDAVDVVPVSPPQWRLVFLSVQGLGRII